MRVQYELTRAPRKSGGVRYEPVASAEIIQPPTSALYVEQDFLRQLIDKLPSDHALTLTHGWPQTLWVEVEVV